MNITKFIYGSLALICTLFFMFSYMLYPSAAWWKECYGLTILLGLIFLRFSRNNIFTIGPLFVSVYLVAIIMPAVPYLYFDLVPSDFFYESIFLNALGLLAYLSVAFYLSPRYPIRVLGHNYLNTEKWNKFYEVNNKIFLFSLPIVIFVIIVSGGWKVFLGGFGKDSGFDRISTLQGFGPLMIFSSLNVFSGAFSSIGLWIHGSRAKAALMLVSCLILNGFTGGRGSMIWVFMVLLLLYGIKKGFSWKILLLAFIAGFGIIFMKFLRGWGTGGESINAGSWQLQLFLEFVGDFDSLNNVAALISYLHHADYPGFYHIWSSILIYVPRFLFPEKPYALGDLSLDNLVFPGVYLGAQGGTGLAFGVAGLWFAVSGVFSLVLGCAFLALIICWFDRELTKFVKNPVPSYLFLLYLLLIGQIIILYREGLYAFMNVFFYFSCYQFMYLLLQNNKYKFVLSTNLSNAKEKD